MGHAKMSGLANSLEGTTYFRLEPTDGLETVGSHDWKIKANGNATLSLIHQAVYRYLQNATVQADLRRCAISLVRCRRSREDTDRWRGFAFGSKYKCKLDGRVACKFVPEGTLFADRAELLDHFQMDHRMPPLHEGNVVEVSRIMDGCRVG